MKNKFIFWLYLVVSAANLTSHAADFPELTRFTKPLLMPLLLLFIYRSSKGKVTLRILLLSMAVLLSWIGDVALMYQGSTSFLVGIGFFLLAHVMYINVLFRSTYQSPSFSLVRVLPFVAYSTALFALLVPGAGDFQIPIIIYGIVISTMAGMARLREGNTAQVSYRLAFYGSLLFLASDSLLAIDKFANPIPFSGVWVMSTYIAAQLLLVIGILKHTD